jgi:hypothetical protein
VLKAAAPVVKVHLKARGSKTRQELERSRLESITEVEGESEMSRLMRLEIQTHCREDRPTAPSSPTEMELATDEEPTDDAALPSSPTEMPIVLISRADIVWSSIFEFWSTRENSSEIFQEQDQLRRLLFKTKKHAVPSDMWIPGAANEVEAVVSNEWALQQLK